MRVACSCWPSILEGATGTAATPGGTPTAEKERKTPRMGSERRWASLLVMSRQAEAPSDTCKLPAQILSLVDGGGALSCHGCDPVSKGCLSRLT